MLFQEDQTASRPYKVLARRYRPQTFSEVIGQETFVFLFKKALLEKRLPHGILLTGIRGIGKTTFARLIAKGLLCKAPNEAEPCNACVSCTSILNESHVDVLEIDGASHTSVDDIRQIIESSVYRPVMGDYKVYIIDEVHMLSKNAFNALLKTLEEPPAHVKFILATTEIHKVPATILSRCQVLYLSPISPDKIKEHLKTILQEEGILYEEEALHLIAQHAEGGLRNALSLLEQILLLSEKENVFSLKNVEEALGLPEKKQIENLFDELFDAKGQNALRISQDLISKGVDPVRIISSLMEITHHRILLLIHNPQHQDLPRLTLFWQMLSKGITEVKDSCLPILSLEMLLVRCLYIKNFIDPSQMLHAIEPTPTPVFEESRAPNVLDFLSFLKKEREEILHEALYRSCFVIDFSLQALRLQWLESKPIGLDLKKNLETHLKRFYQKDIPVLFEEGGPKKISLFEQDQKDILGKKQELLNNPLYQKTLTLFPQATLEKIDPF